MEREAKEARRVGPLLTHTFRRLETDGAYLEQEARGKKKKSTHTPFLPSFARQTKASRAVASGSNKTLDDGTEGPPMRRKRGNQIVSDVAPRESSRKSAVAFKQTVTDRLQETEKRRVRFLCQNRFFEARIVTNAWVCILSGLLLETT